MTKPQIRGKISRSTHICGIAAICIAGGMAALPAAADDGGEASLIDIIIDWIDDLIDPEPTDAELPSDDESW